MEILTVRSGTTFVKKTFDDSRERKLERESVCECVFLSSKMKKERKERKEKGKEWIEEVSGFSRVSTPLAQTLVNICRCQTLTLLFSFRILHFKYKFLFNGISLDTWPFLCTSKMSHDQSKVPTRTSFLNRIFLQFRLNS